MAVARAVARATLVGACAFYRAPTVAVRSRQYASNSKTPMAQWYSSILPAMFPIALLASAVYTGLLYSQLSLSHEKTMEEQATRLKNLEAEVDALHRARQSK